MSSPALATVLLSFSDLAGLAVFAASGALAAARSGQTIVTLGFFALVTGVGGGTARDLLIGAPVFWVQTAWPTVVCLAVAVLVWITPGSFWRGRALEWFDAVGLAAYAVFGAGKALAFEVPPAPAIVMGIFTACIGGVLRDILAGEPTILMRPEIYVTAAAIAAAVHVLLISLGLTTTLSVGVSFVTGFLLRAAAIRWRLALPSYDKKAGS